VDELRNGSGNRNGAAYEENQVSIEERARLVQDELSRQEEDQEIKVKVLSEQLKKVQAQSGT